jgi:dihydroorotate dehydrogenase
MFPVIRALLHRLPPEAAHGWTIKALSHLPASRVPPRVRDPILETRLGPLAFPSPVGLAAGFDKDARVWGQMLALGFGFVEVGTLTPKPQSGNAKPRLFRLSADRAVINRLGFNNGGIDAALSRLRPNPRLGVNVGANRDSVDRIADYADAVARVAPCAAWITLNVSSPNTPGLRGLQDAALPELLAAARAALPPGGPPLFLKVAPDLEDGQVARIARIAAEGGIAALIVGNTTLQRPALADRDRAQAGGLSGRPLAPIATDALRRFAIELGGALPLVAAGGIATGDDVWARMRLGATAVQLYTALVFEGPLLARRIADQLARRARSEGLAQLADIIGADLPRG